MTFLTQDKTNWKYIIIVLILAVIVGMITWQYLLKPQPWSYLIEPTENETKKFLGDESKWGDIKIELKDIQGLFGGRNISISGKGETTVEIATFRGPQGLDIKTYNLLLDESEIKEIINTFIKNDFVTITTEERLGIPDEARPEIILTNAEGKQHKIAVWDNDLQKNERFMNIYQELLLIEKKAETADWETYRNEMYDFEIDYPVVGWKFEECYPRAPTIFSLCKEQIQIENEEDETCIFVIVDPVPQRCYELSLRELIESHDCFTYHAWSIEFEKEIITNSGVKGVKGKGLCGTDQVVGIFFFVPRKLLVGDYHPVLFFRYDLAVWDFREVYPFAEEKEVILNQMISTFRFLE